MFLLCATLSELCAQGLTNYENLISEQEQKSVLCYLSDDMTEGRESGSIGKQYAEQFIREKFKEYGLRPFNWAYTQSFPRNDTTVIRNVVGVVPASVPSDEYIVICAHYDHLGVLGGQVYNGADDNASGVTALLGIAKLFSAMRTDGFNLKKNLIFAAFDGKEFSMAGSRHFLAHLPFSKSQISCVINMDILGSTLVPLHKNTPEYIIVLGNGTLPEEKRNAVNYCNYRRGMRLDLDHTFYGSRDFTRMMYEQGDHATFADAGIPALFFTSGFHQHTYKPSDDAEIIDFKVLRKRTLLIFNVIYILMQ